MTIEEFKEEVWKSIDTAIFEIIVASRIIDTNDKSKKLNEIKTELLNRIVSKASSVDFNKN